MTKGWKLESARHALARKGIETKQTKIPFKDERKEFAALSDERAKELIQEAIKQLNLYKKTNTYSSFSQANEKGWLAFKQKLSSIAERNLVKSGQIKEFVKRNPKYYTVFTSAVAMHNQSLPAGDILPPAEIIEQYLKDVARFVK